MGTFALYVRFPDGEVWHGVYDSVTDTCARWLAEDPEDAGWYMEGDYREEGDLDGQGETVDVTTNYDAFHWASTALRLSKPGYPTWCWLTGPFGCDDETTIWGEPAWLAEYRKGCQR